MRTILFAIMDTTSHLNASFKIAVALRSQGFDIVYLAKLSSKVLVTEKGFVFHSRPMEFQLKELSKKAYDKKHLRTMFEDNFFTQNFFEESIRLYNPKLVIIDASLIYYSVHLLESKIPIITVSTKVCQNKAPGIPPFQSSYIPGKIPLVTNLLVEGLWIIHLIKKKWKDHRDNVSPERLSWYHMARRYMKQLNRHPKFVTKRSSHFGWKDIPELILSPRHFDFPRPFPSNHIHIGPVVNTERREDQNEIDKVSEVLSTEGIKVYCAMGSYDTKFRNDRIKFFVSLINIFLLRRNWQLILSTGRDIDPSGFRPVPDNVHLFQSVPQLHLIKNVDLMITHGGMQSITECILLETPMLVFPLNPNLDQPGNAARVVYHRLGMRGKLKKDTAKQIENKVDELLTNRSFYLKNIQRLKQQMLDSGDFERGIAFIESYIKSQEVIHEA